MPKNTLSIDEIEVKIQEKKKKIQEKDEIITVLKLQLRRATEEHKKELSDLKAIEFDRDVITKEKSINQGNNLKRKRKENKDYLDSLRDYRPDDEEGYCVAIKKNNHRCTNLSKHEIEGNELCSRCYYKILENSFQRNGNH